MKETMPGGWDVYVCRNSPSPFKLTSELHPRGSMSTIPSVSTPFTILPSLGSTQVLLVIT